MYKVTLMSTLIFPVNTVPGIANSKTKNIEDKYQGVLNNERNIKESTFARLRRFRADLSTKTQDCGHYIFQE